MTYIQYLDLPISKRRMDMIGIVNAVIEHYAKQGLDMTLRQLYYQLVAKDIIENDYREYEKLGDLVRDGRLAGLISWDAIVDRGRSLRGYNTYEHPNQILTEAHENYKMDLWATQQWRPEVWVEKQALEGVIASMCNNLRVNFYAQKGYNSTTEQWIAGRRMANYIKMGQRPIVFHLGDHDPSGVDMTRDNRERLELFAGVPVTVVRLGLNLDQIEELKPPPNPAKLSDIRSKKYIEMMIERGAPDPYVSWELDALEPSYIHKLIEDHIMQIRDEKAWDQALLQETEDRRYLEDLADGEG